MKKLLLVLLSFCLTSCSLFSGDFNGSSNNNGNNNNSSSAKSTSIRIEREEEYGRVNDEYVFTNSLHRFVVIETDSDGNEKKINGSYCSWNIKDRDMASVDSSGGITPKKNGNTTIVVKLGDSTASLDIKIATYAKTYGYDSEFKEYRVGNTYNMPLIFTANYQNNNPITVFYTLSNENIIEVQKDLNKFRVKAAGTVDVHAEFFTSSRGEKEHFDFTINTNVANAPYFKYKGSKVVSGSASVAKNKYSSLPLDVFGVTAYQEDGTNISSQIHIEESNYSLTTVGTYSVKLSVTDNRYNATSYFILNLEVTEYEIKTTQSPYDAVTYSNYHVEQQSDVPYTLSIDRLVFECDVTLNSKYDDSDAMLYCAFCFQIKNWGGYITYDKLGGAETLSYQLKKGGPRTIHFDYTFEPNGDMNPDTFVDSGPNVYISGNVYNYIYY